MRKTIIAFIFVLLMFSSICAAAGTEYLYTDSLGAKVYLETASVKPITFKIWDCYKATTKLEFNKPLGNITYTKMYYLINKQNKDYAIVYIENYDINDKLISTVEKAENIKWDKYDKKNDNYKLVDRVFEITK